MTPPNTEQLAAIHAIALRTIEQLPQDAATEVAKLYCKLRASGESLALAELRTSNEANKVMRVRSIREKNILVRHGLDIGVDAWFKAITQVMG